jgi:hypothetical protein
VALPFALSDAVLITAQASLVALPRAAPPARLRRLARRWWALVPGGSIAVVVAAIAVEPQTADVLTYLALVATPLLAAVALARIVPHARPAWALAVLPLLAVAWQARSSPVGQLAALALTGLGCLTLGWLLAAVTPASWLKAGIVAGALVDSWLVFSHLLHQPNATLNAAAPAAGLPQLQFVSFGSAVMGYGDFFIAATLGSLLVVQRSGRVPAAIVCLVIAALFDLLFFVTNELPATVPVAATLLVTELWRTRGAVARPAGPAPAQ